MPRQLQGWGAQTSLLTGPGCCSSSSPADSAWCLTWPYNTKHPLGCGEQAAEARYSLQLGKGHKHWQTPEQWGCPSMAGVPQGILVPHTG